MILRTSKIAALAVMVSMSGGADVAVAGQCGYDYCWGAVGMGPGGAWGYSYGQYSESDAINVLQEECGWDCDTVRTFYNTCGALAEGNTGNWGFGWAGTRSQAENNALGYCSDYGGGCDVRVWACSP